MKKGITSALLTVLGGLMSLQAQASLGGLLSLQAQAQASSVMLNRLDNPGVIADGGEYLEVTISDGSAAIFYCMTVAVFYCMTVVAKRLSKEIDQ